MAQNLFSLEGKNAWITGASYGIGFNIAKAFVAAGIKTIIFNDINEEFLQKGLNNYKEAGITNVKGYVCDVTKEDDVKALVEKIHAEVGNIDILVNAQLSSIRYAADGVHRINRDNSASPVDFVRHPLDRPGLWASSKRDRMPYGPRVYDLN